MSLESLRCIAPEDPLEYRAFGFAGKSTVDGLLIHLHNLAILNETKPADRVRGNKAKVRARQRRNSHAGGVV
jgi:hypothetical protein